MRREPFPLAGFPENAPAFDFSAGPSRDFEPGKFGIGRYLERRPGIYLANQYQGESPREHHVGVDLFAPVGCFVLAFAEGSIHSLADHARAQDYGPTIVTEHKIGGARIWALHGHLSRASLAHWTPGDTFSPGTPLARLGSREENGGWHPHLHFQLSIQEPADADLPGVVSEGDLWAARILYPDPRLALGDFYR